MDRTSVFNPFDSRARGHEDRLTWAFAVALRYDPQLQRFLRALVESRLPAGEWESSPGWDSAVVTTQTTRIGPSASYIVSVLISDATLTVPAKIAWSERRAVYDCLVEFSDGLTLILENKPQHGDVWLEQLSPARESFAGDPDDVKLHDVAVSLEWAEIAEGVLRYAESGVATFGNELMAQDFLALIEAVHPGLGPYRSFELCGNRPEALRRRIELLLESLSQLTGLEVATRPGHPPYLLRAGHVAQELHISASSSGQAATVLRMSTWPGDTVRQARRFYQTVDANAFLSLPDQGWTVRPNFHFSFMSTQLVHASTNMSLKAYFERFAGDAEAYGRKDADDATLVPLLGDWLADDLISQQDADQLAALFIETRRNHINVIPGFRVFRDWPLEEVVEVEKREQLHPFLLDNIEVPLSTWHESLSRVSA